MVVSIAPAAALPLNDTMTMVSPIRLNLSSPLNFVPYSEGTGRKPCETQF